MAVLDPHEAVRDTGPQIPRLDFELTPGCDHKCGHCYNVWNAEEGDPQAGYELRGQLDTPSLLALMTKAVKQTGCEHITLTGGEPLLRRDAMQLVRHACRLVKTVNLITNGSHVGPERAKELADAGLRSCQLTLLAGERALHDELKGAVCFDDTVRAALHLSDAGVTVTICFVAMAANAGQLGPVMELSAALGAKGAMIQSRSQAASRATRADGRHPVVIRTACSSSDHRPLFA